MNIGAVALSVTGTQDAGSPDTSSIIAAIRQLRETGGGLPSERELAGKLNVKRHQLRKALDQLRKSGDIEPSRRAAATRQPRHNEDLVRVTNPLEVIEMRLILEPSFARLASLRASSLDIAQITQWSTTRADDKPDEVDLNFHLAVAAAARNHLAHDLFVMLRQIGVDARMRVARATPATCPTRIAQRDQEHQRIAEAIASRDPEAAEAAMRAHLLLVQRRIIERSNAGLAAA
ncbi:FadR/GntR family transcriptional regulator [Aestuariivirga sp.]|uniref:FadR/GntR family transcriptional regulator n=1 Tax=Aestuariivirga sp. TaxID=2650926 RepID=UPI003593CE28